MGDFNIDLLKVETNDETNEFYNNLTSYFFTPFILQPSRPVSKTLIDNIFINSLEYKSYSGNITIQLSDHLFQFVILEGFFKDLSPPKSNIYERNFKHFNEREFQETLQTIDWDNVLSLHSKDPNLSMENFYTYYNNLLDEFAPYKKLTKKEIKLKTKPWINREILHLMKKRDKVFHEYCEQLDIVKNIIYVILHNGEIDTIYTITMACLHACLSNLVVEYLIKR